MTNATAPAKSTSEKTTDEKVKDYALITISVPNGLHEIADKEATDTKVGLGVLVRRIVAQHFKFDIKSFEAAHRRGRVKYGSEEERKAAMETAQKERAELVAVLMAKYAAGEVTISDDERTAARAKMRTRKPKASK